jgi:hypothetical protein
MSKFLASVPRNEVVGMTTINPACVSNGIPNLGGKLAAPAEVAVMVLVEGQVSFVDIRNNARNGQGC